MSESKGVAKYDREFLNHLELQPIKKVDGYMIFVNNRGRFTADVDGVEVQTDSLEKAEERVHRTVMTAKKKERAKVGRGKSCFLYGTQKGDDYRREPLAAHGFFRGVHAGNGDYMFRLPDGSKGQSTDLTLFRPDDPNVEKLQALDAQARALEDDLRSVQHEIKEIVEPQQEKMLGNLRRGYGGVYIRNDAEKAFEVTISILENVFGEKINVEEEPA